MDILQSDVFAVLDKPADFITNGITHLEYHSDFGLWRLIIYETKKIGLQFDGFCRSERGDQLRQVISSCALYIWAMPFDNFQ